MKAVQTISLILIILNSYFGNSQEANSFEGTIKYSITCVNRSLDSNNVIVSIDTVTIIYQNGNSIKYGCSETDGCYKLLFLNNRCEEFLFFDDKPSNVYTSRVPPEEIPISYEVSSQKDTVLGHSCLVMSLEFGEYHQELHIPTADKYKSFSNCIDYSSLNDLPRWDGIVLKSQYVYNKNQYEVFIIEAISIAEGELNPILFQLPKNVHIIKD